MAQLPADHPDRLTLADEVHARPFDPLPTPSRATYVAVLIDPERRADEHAHVAALCERHGVAPPPLGVRQFSCALGLLRLKWERHGEFSGYTLFVEGAAGAPFAAPASALLPEGWLAALPGATVFAAHAELVLIDGDEWPRPESLAGHFGGNTVVGSQVGDGAGAVFTDFRIHADGYARMLAVNRRFTSRQAGRTLQRLFEIEAYRMLALLALPIAQQQVPRIVSIERALAVLIDDIASESGRDEPLLQDLTRLAAEVERELLAGKFRYGACRAYHELVLTRIAELREQRLPAIQTIGEFMTRRLTPAVATCLNTSQRLHDLSDRVAQASGLLATRVSIARERQNQALLGSMNRRAKLQLRLQQTVEGLSVAAIVYYAAGLVGYLAKAVKAGGLKVEPDLVVGIAIPVLAAVALRTVWKARHHASE